jgi:hypothetical protein
VVRWNRENDPGDGIIRWICGQLKLYLSIATWPLPALQWQLKLFQLYTILRVCSSLNMPYCPITGLLQILFLCLDQYFSPTLTSFLLIFWVVSLLTLLGSHLWAPKTWVRCPIVLPTLFSPPYCSRMQCDPLQWLVSSFFLPSCKLVVRIVMVIAVSTVPSIAPGVPEHCMLQWPSLSFSRTYWFGKQKTNWSTLWQNQNSKKQIFKKEFNKL